MNINNFKEFIFNATDPMAAVDCIVEKLENEGFVELLETEEWSAPKDDVKGIYVVRDDSVIAVRLPKKLESFTGTLTHLDSPCFKIKHNATREENGYTKFNVEPYGGAIFYSWLDKPLSISGRIIAGDYESIYINLYEDYQVFIPSQAIHINLDVNKQNPLNPVKDMCPCAILGPGQNFNAIIKDILEENDVYSALSVDLSLYNPEEVKEVRFTGGKTMLMGPRLDDLASVYAALTAFVHNDTNEDTATVFVAFDNEEIGSNTYAGAGGMFLTSVLERICALYEVDKYVTFANSWFLSIDAAHAIHPNAPEKGDVSNIVKMGEGIVVKHNANYAKDIMFEACVEDECNNNGIKLQHFYSRADMRCGSTLGNINMAHTGIRTLDIGIPMLGMHSSVETICKEDLESLEAFLIRYYMP